MEQLSIFDIFKIGVGPSSSHKLWPWKAALLFRDSLAKNSIGKNHVENWYGNEFKFQRNCSRWIGN